MELAQRLVLLALLLAVSSPCKFIQSPMDFGPLNVVPPTTTKASSDFGRLSFGTPCAVLKPNSAEDISLLLARLSSSAAAAAFGGRVTVAARGAGHSIHGQAQAPDGIVVEMGSLPPSIEVHRGPLLSYADVGGGAMWSEVLEETLRLGLAPRSWTDYLHLTVGGTLSNAGIGGQAFKHGPQISNVLQLDVVTGKGELVTCSPAETPELFYAVLGGLGQFGIITRARIALQEAPHKVRWARAFYDDFRTFTGDQELLISMPEMVDYVEGFVVLSEHSLHGSSNAFPAHVGFIAELRKDRSRIYYCIEFAVHDYRRRETNVEQVMEKISRKMRYMGSHMYSVEVSYFDFLNRVTMEEATLRSRGLWEVPHPWLNFFVPKSGINEFKDLLWDYVSPEDFMGPVLIYPLLRDKWNTNTSAVFPETGVTDRVVYVVGILRSTNPNTCSLQCLRDLLRHNRELAEAAGEPHIGAKQYLGRHPSPGHWQDHFGSKWGRFASHKARFDPLSILGPGQGIFPRSADPTMSSV
ncbi:cytokinin dehydrogenase 3-like [Iris pallida]|uniref:cytokinin dehydrogenase n=1 Tax=Iris pallida TaxID=29817 RepID=A0AAX6E6J1_IRIPA|nr:cytokinin dehydrogenase 3-like [Iris pallida]KAJ6819153.1 cytokinin dehydrogenase 3-like [Iris pallida]